VNIIALISLYAETRPPIIWTSKNEYGRVEIWVDGWWMGKKSKEQKSSKIIDIVSYGLKVSVNGVICVCSIFQVKKSL